MVSPTADTMPPILADTSGGPVALPEPQFSFVLIDQTTDATPAALQPNPDRFQALITAWMEQISGPYAQAYGAVTVAMRPGSNDDRQPYEIAIHFRDKIPEAPGALAFHQVTGGIPDIEIGVSLFNSWSDPGDSEALSVGGSHELLELLGDVGANRWNDLQDAQNRTRAGELCDRCQNTCYAACNGYPVSNFVLPSFFIPGAPAPWDYLGKLPNQDPPQSGDTLGYEIIGSSPANVMQVHGAYGMAINTARLVYAIGALSDRQRARKSHVFSRTHRRGVRL